MAELRDVMAAGDLLLRYFDVRRVIEIELLRVALNILITQLFSFHLDGVVSLLNHFEEALVNRLLHRKAAQIVFISRHFPVSLID